MAIETVEAVRQAELNAAQIEKEAAKECDAIFLKAQKDADEIISSMTKEALEKAKSDLGQTKIKSKTLMKEAEKRAAEGIEKIKKTAKKKEQPAIDLVISEIV